MVHVLLSDDVYYDFTQNYNCRLNLEIPPEPTTTAPPPVTTPSLIGPPGPQGPPVSFRPMYCYTPPNPTCSQWYDHEWLKADFKPDSPPLYCTATTYSDTSELRPLRPFMRLLQSVFNCDVALCQRVHVFYYTWKYVGPVEVLFILRWS